MGFGLASLIYLILSARRAEQLHQLPGNWVLMILYGLSMLFALAQIFIIPIIYAVADARHIKLYWF
jgi:hypothetical protein